MHQRRGNKKQRLYDIFYSRMSHVRCIVVSDGVLHCDRERRQDSAIMERRDGGRVRRI
jgi:hypothetical protein